MVRTPVFASPFPLIALVLVGCSSVNGPVPSAMPGEAAQTQLARIQVDSPPTPDGLVRVHAPELPGALYVRPPRPHLQPYQRILVVDSSIGYARGVTGWNAAEEEALQRYFDRRITEALSSSSGWDLAKEAGEDVLAVAVGVLDLDIRPDPAGPSSSVAYVSASRGAVLVVELRDSNSGKLLLRYMEKRVLPSGSYGGGQVDMRRVRRVFSEFAVSAAEHLEDYHATVREIERAETAARR